MQQQPIGGCFFLLTRRANMVEMLKEGESEAREGADEITIWLLLV
ncbi:hypothetical protein [Paenibacillus sp. B-A-8]